MISHDLVITTYNSYKYLNNIYFFIRDNIFLYSKIICIDDCSEINFYHKLKKKLAIFKNIIIYRNENNLGPSGSRNVGINISNSEYISFHDPDDYVFPK